MKRTLAAIAIALLATPLCAYGLLLYAYYIWHYVMR